MYAICARVLTVASGTGETTWRGSRDVPTFYLDETVQGIVSEDHAARIAAGVINPLGEIPADRLVITAHKVA